MLDWIEKHFNTLRHLQLNVLITDEKGDKLSVAEGFRRYTQCAKNTGAVKGKLIFIGNGGSAAIASHMAIDFSKNGGLPAMAFTDASALTCLSNDYGYEHVYAKQIEYHARKEDMVTLISSSGRSPNILTALHGARKVGCHVMTLSGFEQNNPLSQLGDLNFYIDSKDYGFVEVAHLSIAHAMLDYILEEKNSNEMKRKPLVAVE